jgi:hypothetical protein
MKRFYVIALLVIAVSLGSCSTKFQLVGHWVDGKRNLGTLLGDNTFNYTGNFFKDNTCNLGEGFNRYSCKYSVLDDGRIKIDTGGGDIIIGKLEAGKLVLEKGGKVMVVLYKAK